MSVAEDSAPVGAAGGGLLGARMAAAAPLVRERAKSGASRSARPAVEAGRKTVTPWRTVAVAEGGGSAGPTRLPDPAGTPDALRTAGSAGAPEWRAFARFESSGGVRMSGPCVPARLTCRQALRARVMRDHHWEPYTAAQ